MATVSIPKGTPITVEVSHVEENNRFTAISKKLQKIVNKTGVSVMDILTKLSGTDGIPHSANYFANVTTDPNYKNLRETGVKFWVLDKRVELTFDDEQAA